MSFVDPSSKVAEEYVFDLDDSEITPTNEGEESCILNPPLQCKYMRSRKSCIFLPDFSSSQPKQTGENKPRLQQLNWLGRKATFDILSSQNQPKLPSSPAHDLQTLCFGSPNIGGPYQGFGELVSVIDHVSVEDSGDSFEDLPEPAQDRFSGPAETQESLVRIPVVSDSRGSSNEETPPEHFHVESGGDDTSPPRTFFSASSPSLSRFSRRNSNPKPGGWVKAKQLKSGDDEGDNFLKSLNSTPTLLTGGIGVNRSEFAKDSDQKGSPGEKDRKTPPLNSRNNEKRGSGKFIARAMAQSDFQNSTVSLLSTPPRTLRSGASKLSGEGSIFFFFFFHEHIFTNSFSSLSIFNCS